MSRKGFRYEERGRWRRIRGVTRSRRSPTQFGRSFEYYIRRATLQNALFVRSQLIRNIRTGQFAGNHANTIAIKGSSTPLIDHADMVNSIVAVAINSRTAFVGLKRGSSARDGKDLADIAMIMHEGQIQQVTKKMRNMFYILWKLSARVGSDAELEELENKLSGRTAEIWERVKSTGRIVHPIGRNTKVLVTPERPFLKEVFLDKGIEAKVRENWQRAYNFALLYAK